MQRHHVRATDAAEARAHGSSIASAPSRHPLEVLKLTRLLQDAIGTGIPVIAVVRVLIVVQDKDGRVWVTDHERIGRPRREALSPGSPPFRGFELFWVNERYYPWLLHVDAVITDPPCFVGATSEVAPALTPPKEATSSVPAGVPAKVSAKAAAKSKGAVAKKKGSVARKSGSSRR
jgi:hypothetical protein